MASKSSNEPSIQWLCYCWQRYWPLDIHFLQDHRYKGTHRFNLRTGIWCNLSNQNTNSIFGNTAFKQQTLHNSEFLFSYIKLFGKDCNIFLYSCSKLLIGELILKKFYKAFDQKTKSSFIVYLYFCCNKMQYARIKRFNCWPWKYTMPSSKQYVGW